MKGATWSDLVQAVRDAKVSIDGNDLAIERQAEALLRADGFQIDHTDRTLIKALVTE